MHMNRIYSADTRLTAQYGECFVLLITVGLHSLAAFGCHSGIISCIRNLMRL